MSKKVILKFEFKKVILKLRHKDPRVKGLRITVRAFGPIMEIIGRKQELDLPTSSTLDDLAKKLENDAERRNGKTHAILNSNLTILVNGMNVEARRSRALNDGDHVDILSPFVGG